MGGDRILGLLGDWNLFDYMDALAEKGNASSLLQCLWSEALLELPWQRVELRHVPASSPLLRALQVACEQEGLAVAVERDEVCPVALLCSSWEAYLQMLSKKQRHEIRRKLRRVQEDAEWDWRTSRSLAELDRDLESFFDLHEASADDKAGFLTSDVRAFFRAVSAWALRCGWLRLSVLRRNGVDIASTLSFAYRDRWLLYNSGYDPAFSALSPGIAAVALAMQDAIAEKAVAFDFLSGNEPYKYQFGASDTHTCRAVVTR
jgi:CelD/BcsL family acetyltransferase involved in cellulose biosynthesis